MVESRSRGGKGLSAFDKKPLGEQYGNKGVRLEHNKSSNRL